MGNFFFFFQAEDGIRDLYVTGVQTCALPILTRGAGGDVRALRDEPVHPPCVTGGVYGLSAGMRRAAADAVAGGGHRMRGFLKAVVADGRRVASVEVPRIIDIDRPSDLQHANAWLAAREP